MSKAILFVAFTSVALCAYAMSMALKAVVAILAPYL